MFSKQSTLTGTRFERAIKSFNLFDNISWSTRRTLARMLGTMVSNDRRFAQKVIVKSESFRGYSDSEIDLHLTALRTHLRCKPLDSTILIKSFAIIRELSGRSLGMYHHHTQIMASLALSRGEIAEMATGEGKTLAATLAVATAALSGIPVHVVTVNDYLAGRDAEELLPLYARLGLTCGVVTHGIEPAERRAAYACDICYCCNKELVFDYLKDRIALDTRVDRITLQQSLFMQPQFEQQLLLRGLHFAVVDEADSVFVDESRTPLIISGEESFGAQEESLIVQALELAQQLEEGEDFFQHENGGVQLLPNGEKRVEKLALEFGGIWVSKEYRSPLVARALAALHRYQLNQDYIISEDGEVQIVDPYTGRVTTGRSWGQGLHQMIELKESLQLTKPRQTQAEISYQNFFRKYACLAGMTGTGTEVRRELGVVYRTACSPIPLLLKSQRKKHQTSVYTTLEEKYNAVAQRAQSIHQSGQPLLIGTATIEASERLAEYLSAVGLPFSVLNARQDKDEADIIATAGQRNAITIATGMAGRGTDIKLSDASRDAGGLHVLVTELQEASRIDRQLYGRSARQGDPGAYTYMLSLEDGLLVRMLKPKMRKLLVGVVSLRLWRHLAGYYLLRFCQWRMERLHYKQRKDLLQADVKRQRMLSFSGKSEYSS